MIFHTLRKGLTSVFLEFEHVGDSMCAESVKAKVEDGVLTLRLTIRPVGSGQKSDVENLHTMCLQSVQIHDQFVIDKLFKLISGHSNEISELRLELLSKGMILAYSASLGANGIGFLPLLVQRINA